MILFALSALATGVVALFFGGLVVLKDSKNLNNRLFFLMCLSVGVWGVSYWFWLTQTTTRVDSLFWVTILTGGSLLASLFFFHWVLVTTKATGKIWDLILASVYGVILGFLTILIFKTHLLIGPMSEKLVFPLWPNAGPIYIYYIIAAYLIPIIIALGRVTTKFLTSRKEAKQGQLISIFVGALLGFGGTGMNFFLWFDIEVLPYGNFAAILFAPLLGYSIIRHRLFTFRTIATELLVLFTITGVFVQIFLASSFTNLVLQIIFFLAVSISSFLLLKSVYKEVETREKLEVLTGELKRTNTKLKELDRQKSEFLSIATHQLRGPLAGIRGHLSLVIDGSYGEISKKAHEIIGKVFESSGMLAKTINDFLNVSRIEQGSMQYDKKKFEASDLVKDVVEELQPLASDRGLELTFVNKCEKGSVIYADYAKIRHIFFNLIDNAIKYTEKGWVKVEIFAGNVVHIEVKDSGIGIATNEIHGVFEKFVRARDASGINVNGTGLGLYVARQMVEAHKGKIWVESEGEGKGSTFIVELPASQSA